jgi:hypothetical protein
MLQISRHFLVKKYAVLGVFVAACGVPTDPGGPVEELPPHYDVVGTYGTRVAVDGNAICIGIRCDTYTFVGTYEGTQGTCDFYVGGVTVDLEGDGRISVSHGTYRACPFTLITSGSAGSGTYIQRGALRDTLDLFTLDDRQGLSLVEGWVTGGVPGPGMKPTLVHITVEFYTGIRYTLSVGP